jgi:hypothetical protein
MCDYYDRVMCVFKSNFYLKIYQNIFLIFYLYKNIKIIKK